MAFFVYIIYSKSIDRFYVGETPNIEQRLKYHNSPKLNTNSTKSGMPWEVFMTISCDTRTIARKVEKHIKRMKSRKYYYNLKQYPELVKKVITKYS